MLSGPSDQRDDLTESFQRAGLQCALAKRPFARGVGAHLVFGMAIAQRDSDAETFEIWRGEETSIRVSDVDPGRRQLVMHIEEPAREFDQEWTVSDKDELVGLLGEAGSNFDVVKRDGPLVTVRGTTPAAERTLLLGMDETHYFIAQLRGHVETVDEAHLGLRPAEADRPGTKRQGEWFFVPLTDEESAQLEAYLERARRGPLAIDMVARGVPLDKSTGTPHIVDELLQRPGRGWSQYTFARGVVTQAPRHRPLDLGPRWHAVVRNLEAPLLGVDWVD